jgi:hypothetical protein
MPYREPAALEPVAQRATAPAALADNEERRGALDNLERDLTRRRLGGPSRS